MTEGMDNIYSISKEILINLGIKDGGPYHGAVPFLFWTLFILWIIYIILGHPEIAAKLKRLVLIVYFVPVIPSFLFNYLKPPEDEVAETLYEHFQEVVITIIFALLWPFMWMIYLRAGSW
tara:strand:+ start:376 stop:735 length:360 start_codon:yes stop_codon:yes gene_type:complete